MESERNILQEKDYSKSIQQSSETPFSLDNATVTIQNSNDIIVGNVTNFNGQVTIIQQNINKKPTVNSPRHVATAETTSNSKFTETAAATPAIATPPSAKIKTNLKFSSPFWFLFVVVSSSAFLIIIVTLIITILVQNSYFEKETVAYVSDNKSIRYIDRDEWGGWKPLAKRPLSLPVDLVIVIHTGGTYCRTGFECSEQMRILQNFYLAEFSSPDIGHNFLIGGDGNIYIGRGWDTVNAVQDDTISICFIGNYIKHPLSDMQIMATKMLLNSGVKLKKLSENYKLVAHNQTTGTLSPGINVYQEIIKWKHWTPGNF